MTIEEGRKGRRRGRRYDRKLRPSKMRCVADGCNRRARDWRLFCPHHLRASQQKRKLWLVHYLESTRADRRREGEG